MPAGKIRAGYVTHFPAFNQMVERAQDFIDRSERVESVKMVDVNVIGGQTTQTGFTGLQQVMPRRSQIVRVFTHSKRGLGRDQNIVAAPRNCFPKNFFREAFGVNVGSVKEVDAALQTDGDEAAGFSYVGCAPGAKKLRSPTKCPGAKTERGHLQSRTTMRVSWPWQTSALATCSTRLLW